MPLGILRDSDVGNVRLDARERAFFKALKEQTRIAYLQCLLQEGVAGRFEKPVRGSDLLATTQFVQAVRNGGQNPIAVSVSAQFTGAVGKQVRLSYSGSEAASEVVEYLGNTASAPSFGRVISRNMILLPGQELWIANVAPVIVPCVAADTFSVRVFDVSKFIVDAAWESTPL